MATKVEATVPALPMRTPVLALLFSLLWPGVGQVYNGQVRKGIILMVLYVMSLFLTYVSPIGFVAGGLLLVYGTVNAYHVAEYYERWIGGPQKRCPHCGKAIQEAADGCRFCGGGWRSAA
jgi:TM2 domain-containing membrane protein YozV